MQYSKTIREKEMKNSINRVSNHQCSSSKTQTISLCSLTAIDKHDFQMFVSHAVVVCSATAEAHRGGAEARAQIPQRHSPQGEVPR